ncbi:MAG: endonuclease IV [Candidatus Bathyarchaeota archaeon BA1]|nr:MAG: endonuclease IV [Candidatus Bathyarchaeota archaeon BA1]
MLFCLGKPFPNLMKHLQKVDVHHVELYDEGLHALNNRRIQGIKKLTRSRGLKVTIHAPVADINIASPNPSLRRVILKRLEKSILYASQLDCRLWVFHPGLKTGVSSFYPGLDWQLNLKSIRALLEFARRHNVEIAIENAPEPYPFLIKSVSDFSRLYDELGEDIGLVLDIGHANLNHQIQDFIKQFSDRIIHMHVSDNDGAHDSHLGIGHGTIDWKDVVKAIRKIGYGNAMMMESVEHVEESLQTLRKFFT